MNQSTLIAIAIVVIILIIFLNRREGFLSPGLLDRSNRLLHVPYHARLRTESGDYLGARFVPCLRQWVPMIMKPEEAAELGSRGLAYVDIAFGGWGLSGGYTLNFPCGALLLPFPLMNVAAIKPRSPGPALVSAGITLFQIEPKRGDTKKVRIATATFTEDETRYLARADSGRLVFATASEPLVPIWFAFEDAAGDSAANDSASASTDASAAASASAAADAPGEQGAD